MDQIRQRLHSQVQQVSLELLMLGQMTRLQLDWQRVARVTLHHLRQ